MGDSLSHLDNLLLKTDYLSWRTYMGGSLSCLDNLLAETDSKWRHRTRVATDMDFEGFFVKSLTC